MTEPEPLRAILVGCGSICTVWLPHALKHPHLRIVGLVDIDLEQARRRATEYSLSEIHLDTDLASALSATSADLVFDCTIPAAHHVVTATALQRGCHVLGEKPMADSMEHARISVAASREAGRLYAVVQNRRYSAGARRLRAFLESGALGRITTACCDFFIGVTFTGFRREMEHVLLLDMSIHHFDLARFLLGGAAAQAVSCHEWNPPGSPHRHGAAAEATFEMEGGSSFLYRGSWCSQGMDTSWQGTWRIVGENGTVLWDGEDALRAEVVDNPGTPEKRHRSVEIPPAAESPALSRGHSSVIDEFVAAVRAGTVPETVCTDNIQSLAMVFGAIESAGCGARVELPPA